jgi:CDP-glucose 4,6-dehydratase
VLEPLHGYLVLAQALAQDADRFAGGWNFGPAEADARPVGWLANALVRLWGPDAAWCQDTASHPREANFLKLDASKAHADLGWHPHVPLPGALAWIVEWYRACQAGSDLRATTEQQIERYAALLRQPDESAASAGDGVARNPTQATAR